MNAQKKTYLAVSFVTVALIGIGWIEHMTRPPKVAGTSTSPSSVPHVSDRDKTSSFEPASPDRQASSGNSENADKSNLREVSVLTKTSDILADPSDDFVATAKKLLAVVKDPKQPPEERETALAHAINLATGNESEVLLPLVRDADLPEKLTASILEEALNRPLEYQIDLYLTALSTQKSAAMQAKIRKHLAFLTDSKDLGADPAAWLEVVANTRKKWTE
jgi:hypothetical protein